MVKNPLANVRHMDPTAEMERSPGERNNNPFQYFCLGNPMDRGAWRTTVYGVTKRFRCDLANKQQQHIWNLLGGTVVENLPATQEIQETWVWSLNWKFPWRRKWQPTPVFLPRKFHGQRDWWATVLGATKSQTRLSAYTHTHFSIENPKKENENLEGIQIIEHGQ